jgi:hypothetical protein
VTSGGKLMGEGKPDPRRRSGHHRDGHRRTLAAVRIG